MTSMPKRRSASSWGASGGTTSSTSAISALRGPWRATCPCGWRCGRRWARRTSTSKSFENHEGLHDDAETRKGCDVGGLPILSHHWLLHHEVLRVQRGPAYHHGHAIDLRLGARRYLRQCLCSRSTSRPDPRRWNIDGQRWESSSSEDRRV